MKSEVDADDSKEMTKEQLRREAAKIEAEYNSTTKIQRPSTAKKNSQTQNKEASGKGPWVPAMIASVKSAKKGDSTLGNSKAAVPLVISENSIQGQYAKYS
jgi:hypothetical protein